MPYFDHEQLICYQLGLDVARELAITAFPRGEAQLKDQAVRASRSVVLNIAEGRARGGQAGRNHYRIAHGSAAETSAALDLSRVRGAEPLQKKLRRIGSLLSGLT